MFPCSKRLNLPNESYTDERNFLSNTFRNNSFKIRNKLFSEPLIRYLWSVFFIVEDAKTCIQHLRRIRSLPDNGEEKYWRYLGDLHEIGLAFNFEILPSSAWNDKNAKVFSQEEQELDLIENSKYNKKLSPALRDKIY